MRTDPPHWVARNRFLFLLLAVAAWCSGALALSQSGSASFTRAIGCVAAIVFIWSNGVFWALQMAYPYIESKPGVFVSHIEQAPEVSKFFFTVFFIGYVLIGTMGTFVCLRLVAGG